MSTEPKGDVADRALVERQWPVTVKLTHPINFADETITELKFRRGRMGDVRGMTPDRMPSMDELMLLASRMCGQPVKVMELLDGDDGPEVLAIALGFFAKFLGTGTEP
jgi:hypothetical protein